METTFPGNLQILGFRLKFTKFSDFPCAARSPHHSWEPGRHPGWVQLDEKCYSEKKSRSKKNSKKKLSKRKIKISFFEFFQKSGRKKIENPKFSIFGRNFRNFDFFEKTSRKNVFFRKSFFNFSQKVFNIF